MYKHETFPNAPITEALLDIRVNVAEDKNLSSLDPFSEAVAPLFPEKEIRKFFRGGIEIKEDEPPEFTDKSSEPIGYVYRNLQEAKALQARIDGFSFSKLKPYENWPSLRDEAKDYWSLYCDICQPISVNRLALRYINKIEIPLPIRDFRDFILTSPEISQGIPQGILDMFFRVVIPDEKSNLISIITSTIDAGEDEKILPYIFDIDSSASCDFPIESNDIWNLFEELREFKNRIFFLSITEKARALFR